jgi:hypothetical protein
MNKKFENAYDTVHKTKYKTWMRKLIFIVSFLFLLVSIAIVSFIKYRGGDTTLMYFALLPLSFSLISFIIGKKGSDKFIAYIFGGYSF